MKAIKLGGIAFFLLALVYMSGCYNSSYYFNFASEGDLENEEGAWITDEGTFGVGEAGLFLDDSWITTPLEFSGDFKITANVWFQAVVLVKGNIKISISNIPWKEDPDQWARFALMYIGTENEELWADEGGTGNRMVFQDAFEFDTLNRSGWNEIMLEKVANVVSLYIKGALVYEFPLLHCNSDYYAVNFRFDTEGNEDPESPAFGGVMKDVKVQYKKGNAQPIL